MVNNQSKENLALQTLRREQVDIQGRILNDYEKINDYIFTNNRIEKENEWYPELEEVRERFNNLISRTEKIFEILGTPEEVSPKRIHELYPEYTGNSWFFIKGKALSALRSANDECNKILTTIDSLLFNIKLTPKRESELNSLRREIEENIKPRLPLYASDLNYAIESFRKNDLLGSVLISGRVMDIIVDKLKKEITREKRIEEEKIKLEDITKFLQGKIKEKEIPLVTQAIKLWRNKFSHNIGVYPEIGECIITISGTVELIKKIQNFNIAT